jgi:arginine exporter protein ArgO
MWFFFISYGSALCARWFVSPRVQRGIDLVIGATMFSIACKLMLT